MDKYSATILFSFFHEINNFIETTFNIFSDMIFQVKREVFNTLVDVIIGGVVSCTIDYMCHAILF